MNALIIFTKIPIPGFTKTRLHDFFTPEQCAKLTKCFLRDLFYKFSELKNFDVFLYYTPKGSTDLIKDIIPVNILAFPQKGISIGDRMYSAMNEIFNKRYTKVVLVGSDIPDLNKNYVLKAFKNLDCSDIVFGPTLDGGYYLVGCKKENLSKDIFTLNEEWSTSSVLDTTINIIAKNNLKVSFLKTLRDIDTKNDILKFYEKIKNNDDISAVKKFLKELL